MKFSPSSTWLNGSINGQRRFSTLNSTQKKFLFSLLFPPRRNFRKMSKLKICSPASRRRNFLPRNESLSVSVHFFPRRRFSFGRLSPAPQPLISAYFQPRKPNSEIGKRKKTFLLYFYCPGMSFRAENPSGRTIDKSGDSEDSS